MLGKIQYNFSKNNWQIDNIQYADMVELSILCEKSKLEEIKKALIDITNDKYTLIDQEEIFILRKIIRFIMMFSGLAYLFIGRLQKLT